MNLNARLCRIEKVASTNDLPRDVVEGEIEAFNPENPEHWRDAADRDRARIHELEGRGEGAGSFCEMVRGWLREAETNTARLEAVVEGPAVLRNCQFRGHRTQ